MPRMISMAPIVRTKDPDDKGDLGRFNQADGVPV